MTPQEPRVGLVSTAAAQAGFTTEHPVEKLFLWRQSEEYKQLFGVQSEGTTSSKFPRVAEVSLISAGFLLLAAAALQPIALSTSSLEWRTVWHVFQILAVGGAFMCAVGCVAKYVSARKSFLDRVRILKAASVNEALANLGENPTIGQLYKLNRKQLDEYHILSVRQQKLSFQAAQAATAVAFLVLLAGAIYVIARSQSGDEFKTYVTGGLSAAGAILSGFVAKTFYGSYKRTSRQLLQYYREPSRTNFLLNIERLVQSAPLASSDETGATQRRVWEEFLVHLFRDFSWALRHEGDADVFTPKEKAETDDAGVVAGVDDETAGEVDVHGSGERGTQAKNEAIPASRESTGRVEAEAPVVAVAEEQ